jgi:DNA-binding Lrp family transcriptional regulator
MDEIDKKIIDILKKDAKKTNEEIGKIVGLSEPAVRRRIHKLIKEKIIKKFTIEIEDKENVFALVFISVSTDKPINFVIKKIENLEGVEFIFETSGESDIVLLLVANNMTELNNRLDQIRSFEAIKQTKTSIILKKWK